MYGKVVKLKRKGAEEEEEDEGKNSSRSID
jgi:hypothetical protein